MTQAYTPGLKATDRTLLRRRRALPIRGRLNVNLGDQVSARDVIARADLPGEITPLNVVHRLSIMPAELPAAMLAQVGESITVDQIIARSKGIFGWFRKECRSPVVGIIETISSITGQLMIRGAPLPVQLHAFLSGTVVETIPDEGAVIEAEGAFIQGIFGVGGEAYGPIALGCRRADETLAAEQIESAHRGAVLVGGGRVTAEALKRAVEVGVSAIVTGGIDDQDLRDFLGYDLGVATTGSEKVGVTVIITEGFGDVGMAGRSFELLGSRVGEEAAVNGATQIRAGVQRPEIIIPDRAAGIVALTTSDSAPRDRTATEPEEHTLRVGLPVRIIRDPYFGMIGAVTALPSEPRVLGSESKARVLEVRLPQGELVLIPRANVELIEG